MEAIKKKIKIEDATAFKLEYYEGGSELKSKEFNSYKALEQFHNRQADFLYIDCNRYAFINNEWHRFIKLSSPFIFQHQVDYVNNLFNDKIEDKNLQQYITEE